MKKIVLPLVLVLALLGSTVAFAAGSLNLPGGPVSATWDMWDSSRNGMTGIFDVTLSSVPAGYDVSNGVYPGWCVQKLLNQDTNQYMLYSSDDSLMPPNAKALPWDKVNYLLNHRPAGVNAWDVQTAIWVVLGQELIANVSSAAAAMAQDALDNGAGFAAAPGQIVAVILYSDGFGGDYDKYQEMIIEVKLPSRGGPGTGTPGYWKNHPEAWPQDSITIGGVTYTKDQAIALMGMPDGDKTYTMFRALVAGKLNVMIGNDASCVATTITDADNWMMTYGPAGSKVKASSAAWKVGEPLYNTLDAYNNGYLCAPHRD